MKNLVQKHYKPFSGSVILISRLSLHLNLPSQLMKKQKQNTRKYLNFLILINLNSRTYSMRMTSNFKPSTLRNIFWLLWQECLLFRAMKITILCWKVRARCCLIICLRLLWWQLIFIIAYKIFSKQLVKWGPFRQLLAKVIQKHFLKKIAPNQSDSPTETHFKLIWRT